MIKTLFMTLCIVLSLSFIHSAPSYSEGTCKTLEELTATTKTQIYTLSPSGVKKIVDMVNKNRMVSGKEPIEGDAFYYTQFEDGNIGVALFNKGCAVPGLTAVINIEQFTMIMESAGVKSDESMKVSDA